MEPDDQSVYTLVKHLHAVMFSTKKSESSEGGVGVLFTSFLSLISEKVLKIKKNHKMQHTPGHILINSLDQEDFMLNLFLVCLTS